MRNITGLTTIYMLALLAADAGAGTGGEVTTTDDSAVKPAEPFSYDEDREFFEVSELQKGAEKVGNIVNQKNEDGSAKYHVVSWEGDWPEGAGMAILPLARNETLHKGTKDEVTARRCFAVMVWPYWGLDAVMSHENGAKYLASIIEADQAARILNPMRKQAWEEGKFDPTSCPKSLADHIEGMAADGGAVKSYNELAKVMLPSLKGMSPVFKNFNPALLRQYLSNAPLARSFSAEIEDSGFWVKIIEEMKAAAIKANMNAEVFDQWLATRNEQQAVDLTKLDLSKLSFTSKAA